MEKFFGCGFLATARNVKNSWPLLCTDIQKIIQIWAIYYISNCWKFSAEHEFSNDDLTWFKEVIDLGFRRILSNVVIFGWPVINDQFFPLLMVKIFDIPYFEVKDTALEKHRKTLKKIVEFFIVNSIGLLSSLPSNRTCWTVFILIF